MTGKQPKRKGRPGVDRYGRTDLHYVSLEGDVASIRRLLAAGLDANASDDNGMTSLHFAVQSGHLGAVLALLDAGAHVDPQDSHGNTPLATAVFNSKGDGTIIAALREHGADPGKENRHGVSPLSLARTIANYDVAQFFRDYPPT